MVAARSAAGVPLKHHVFSEVSREIHEDVARAIWAHVDEFPLDG